jgi:CRISPR-associated protein Csd2
MNNVIKNRYDFVFLFDVKDGNPNGDPDQANLPRADAENQEGLVTDVCIKRKVRNYIQVKHQFKSPYNIFIRQRDINADDSYLNYDIEKAKGDNAKDKKKTMCDEYYDIRTFGAVLSTGGDSKKNDEDNEDGKKKKEKGGKVKGAGTVRGPVQFTFSRSEDRIYQADHSLTRCCVTTENEVNEQKKKGREFASTFGRKSTVPYALYRMHGFISAVDAIKTGFSDADLDLLWESLINAFEHDRAAARGEMNPRKLIIFKHSGHLGNARSGELFNKISIRKNVELPRNFSDYEIVFDKKVPEGIEIIEKL